MPFDTITNSGRAKLPLCFDTAVSLATLSELNTDVGRRLANRAKRQGVRQPSGAFGTATELANGFNANEID
jgi:hypothetical protein